MPVVTPLSAPTAATEESAPTKALGKIPTKMPEVTALLLSVGKISITAGDPNCNFTQTFSYTICTNRATAVHYSWNASLNGQVYVDSGLLSAVFNSEEGKTFNDHFDQLRCGRWTVTLAVTSPNSKSVHVSFDVFP